MLVLVSAFLILLMYFLAGVSKISSFTSTVQGLKTMIGFKLPIILYKFAILGAIILEIVAPLIIMLSLQTNMYKTYAYYSSVILALFTVLITLIYHFPTNKGQYYSFMKNTTAVGALLLLSTIF
jgi:uncharacterized membrane protein YphA (DoxX/SURF4 family)